MALTIIEQGFRNVVVLVTGDAPVTLNVANLQPPCAELRLEKVVFNTPSSDATSTIEWEATVNTLCFGLSGPGDTFCFEDVGGIPNYAGAGKTGNAIITPADTNFTAVIYFKKVYPVTPYPN